MSTHICSQEGNGHLLRRVQARVAASTASHPGSAADELIADRRAEASREDASPNATAQDSGSPGQGAR